MTMIKKKYRLLIGLFAVIISIAVCAALICMDPNFKAGFFNRPTEEDYNRLISYANTYAKTLDRNFIGDDSVEITTTQYTDEGIIIITVNEVKCKVSAAYPLVVNSEKEGEFVTRINYQNGVYIQSSNLKTIDYYIFGVLIGLIVYAAIVYLLITLLILWRVNKKENIKK